MVFTDPPYNVKVDGHVSGNSAIKHREFKELKGGTTGVIDSKVMCEASDGRASAATSGTTTTATTIAVCARSESGTV